MPRRTSRRPRRRTSARPRRRTSRVKRNGAIHRAAQAAGRVRASRRGPRGTGLNADVRRWLAQQSAGLYRVGGTGKYPAITQFKRGTKILSAMTSTRIAASRSKESHWLVKVYPSGSPKAVVLRKIDKKGKTVFRLEDRV